MPHAEPGSVKAGYRALARRDRSIHNALMAFDHFLGRHRVDRVLGSVRARMHGRLVKDLAQRGRVELTPIERRKGLTHDEFYERYFKPCVPVLIEGAAADWPCVGKWSLEFFADRYGDDEIGIIGERYPHEKGIESESLTLRRHIELFEDGPLKYLTFYPVFARHPELVNDFDFDWLRRWQSGSTLYHHCQLFLGPRDSETGVHNAQWCNLFVQAYGEKRWRIYPPGYCAIMDPASLRSIYRPSYVNHPDSFQAQADAIAHVRGFEAFTKPGDVLWNPPFWWHRVNNLTHSIGVGYRWNNNRLAFRESPTMWLLDLFATNPSFWSMFVQGRREAREMQRGFDQARARA